MKTAVEAINVKKASIEDKIRDFTSKIEYSRRLIKTKEDDIVAIQEDIANTQRWLDTFNAEVAECVKALVLLK